MRKANDLLPDNINRDYLWGSSRFDLRDKGKCIRSIERRLENGGVLLAKQRRKVEHEAGNGKENLQRIGPAHGPSLLALSMIYIGPFY